MSNPTKTARGGKRELIAEIAGVLVRRHSTAGVLLHHAVAESLGLGPTDHKCLDLLREHSAVTGSELAAMTGLTTGAITGVVARLEGAGYLTREPDPEDGRRQVLRPRAENLREIHDVLSPMREELAELLRGLETEDLAVIAGFLDRTTELAYRHIALLRSASVHRAGKRQADRKTTRKRA